MCYSNVSCLYPFRYPSFSRTIRSNLKKWRPAELHRCPRTPSSQNLCSSQISCEGIENLLLFQMQSRKLGFADVEFLQSRSLGFPLYFPLFRQRERSSWAPCLTSIWLFRRHQDLADMTSENIDDIERSISTGIEGSVNTSHKGRPYVSATLSSQIHDFTWGNSCKIDYQWIIEQLL